MEEAKTSKIYKELNISGYIVDEDLLKRVDEVCAVAIAGSEGDDKPGVPRYMVLRGRDEMVLKSLDGLVKELDRSPKNVRTVTLRRTLQRKAGIDVVLSDEGEIRISGFSRSPDFGYNVERLHELLLTSREEHSWVVRAIVDLSFVYRGLIYILLGILSVVLLVSVGYYFYATRIGVNIDPSLIPKGNEHLQKVADALKSTDLLQKLDALLLADLAGFQNVRDVLATIRREIVLLLSGVVVIAALLFARRLLKRLYPQCFFLFGQNRKVFASLQTKRQIWGVAIVIGFVVNVVAGILVAVAMR